MDKIAQAKGLLKQVWGYGSYRKGQEDIVKAVLSGKNVFAILPTGSGKSIGYQLPALILDGVCIVITPLIALMQDQVARLRKLKINSAAIHSGLSKRQIDMVLDNCIYGNTKLLYISPERIDTPLFKERIRKMKISFVAVDEAHCVSQWGHDFRPSYRKIATIREIQDDVKIVALTATATSKVADDIKQQLEIDDCVFIKESFERKNLSINILNSDKKIDALDRIISKSEGSSIIYVRHRKTAYELSKHLSGKVSCDYYHAGLSHKERSAKQTKWLQGGIKSIIATNAFGMGIDKADVRTVIHYGLSPSIEEYYQEIGRAGRDNQPAHTYVLHNENDVNRLRTSHEKSFPVISDIRKAYSLLHNYFEIPIGQGEFRSCDLDIGMFAKYCGSNIAEVYRLVKQLEKLGFIKLSTGLRRQESIKLLADRKLVFELKGNYRKIAVYLLRNIENVYHTNSPINTKKVAKELDVEHQELLSVIDKMSLGQLIKYNAASEKPFLTFLQDRFAKQNLRIDEAAYLERRSIEKEKYESMIGLAKSEECRIKFILNYFEETYNARCGKCDNCKKGDFVRGTTTKAIKEMIIRQLDKPSTIEQVIDSYEYYKQASILTQIQQMINSKELVFRDKRLFLN